MEFKDYKPSRNNVEVIYGERKGDLCHVRFLFNVGSYYEDDTTRGISHLIEHLMFNCCPGISALEFNAEMDKLGMSINASTSWEFTRFFFTGLKENYKKAFELYYNLLKNFTVTQEILDKEVGIVCNEIGVSKDDNWEVLYNNVNSQAFKTHPIKDPILGYEDVLRALTPEKVQEFYDRFYCAENMKIIVIGDFSEDEILELQNMVADYKLGEKSEIIQVEDKQAIPLMHQIVSYKDGIFQTFIDTFVPYKFRDFNIFSGYVAAKILGGSMSSFLWDEFREKRSLCYIIGADEGEIDFNNARLHMYSSLNNSSDVETAQEIFKSAIEYLKNVDEDVFNKGLIQAKTSMAISSEKITSLANRWENYNYFYRGEGSFDDFENQLNLLTFDEFKRFTDALNVEDMVTGIIYPQDVQG